MGQVNRSTGASNNDALDIRIADTQPEAQPLSAERLAPHSVEAEEAILGSVLINGSVISELSAFLKADDFFILKHSLIWECLLAMFERGQSIDYLTLIQELQSRGQLEDVGGPAFITRIIRSTPTYMHAETYGHLVEAAAVRRRLISAASEIAQAAQDETSDLTQIIARAESTLFGVTERQGQRELLPIQAALSDYYERIEYHYDHRDEPIGLPTGFNDLDELLAGVQPSDLIIVAARPGVGKTSFLLSMALNAARLGNARVGIFSLEMSSEQLVQRLISSDTGINAQKLRSGNLDDSEWDRFTQAVVNLAELPIFLDDSPGLSPMALRAKCRRLSREHGLDLVIVDYLQLMESGQGRSDNRVQEVGYISRHLKELARELNVPLISAAQLSRQVEQRTDKHPQLSDLRESGCLTGDTPIYLPDSGSYVPIRSLVGTSGFRVLSLNPETWKHEAAVVTNAFHTGCKPVFRLTTQLGRTIRATANHKFLTIDGWKRLDELTSADCIAVPYSVSPHAKSLSQKGETYTHNTPELVSVLGNTSGLPAPLGRGVGGEGLHESVTIDSDVYWDAIDSVVPDGEADVYDLTVPAYSNFVASNIIVHNSIEQDADVIMFIYRDELYNEQSERPNQADIIVAKHRNGPTGAVTLHFNKALTKFGNLKRETFSLND